MRSFQVQHHLRRATDFFDGMQLTRSDDGYRNSAALLAVHCAISYNDALRVGLGSTGISAENHQVAVAEIESLLSLRKYDDRTGITHLRALISKKTLVSYGNERLDQQDFLGLVTKAERFAKWANEVGKQLKIEGWRGDD